MDAFVGSLDGKTLIRDEVRGSMHEPEALGTIMVERLRELGADEVLAEVRGAGAGGVSALLGT
jgi:hydroxymethylbilane synthase